MKANKVARFSWFWIPFVDGILTWKRAGECLLVISLIATLLILQTKIWTPFLERNPIDIWVCTRWKILLFVWMDLLTRIKSPWKVGVGWIGAVVSAWLFAEVQGHSGKQKQFLLYCAWKSIQISRRVCFIFTLLNVVLLILLRIVCMCVCFLNVSAFLYCKMGILYFAVSKLDIWFNAVAEHKSVKNVQFQQVKPRDV